MHVAAFERMHEKTSEPEMVGASEAIRAIDRAIDAAARSDAKVLITGETGSGKDVVASLIHRRSNRRTGRLLTINCAGVPDSLLESELFGHARGSFTGAYRDKPGLFEQAHNGTVFLDEVGEMSLRMQAVLLRFLESGELQRVGGGEVRHSVNVRVVAATNRDPHAHIASGAFRADLFYRLNVIPIHVPPLRERKDDVTPILEYWLRRCTNEHRLRPPVVSSAVLDALKAYDWPGNVRQLRNVVEQLLLRAVDRPIALQDLPPEIRHTPAMTAQRGAASGSDETMSEVAELMKDMVVGGACFWAVVYPRFMSRDLPRSILREVVARGLARTAGNYRTLVTLFNMPATDYKRFLNFLRKHGCLVPFLPYRGRPDRLAAQA
jgi:transcriptional regulator with PAS, ATPase and Fis domain